MTFEPVFSPALPNVFKASIEKPVVTDIEGLNPSSIISMEDKFHLEVKWNALGTLTIPIDQWHVRVYVESLGPGPEKLIAKVDQPRKLDGNYSATFDLDSVQLGLRPGLYKLVAVLTTTYKDPLIPGVVKPYPIAAFEEGPVLQFFSGESWEGE